MALGKSKGPELGIFLLEFADTLIILIRGMDKNMTVVSFEIEDAAVFQHIAGVAPFDQVTTTAVFPYTESTFEILPEIFFLDRFEEKLERILAERGVDVADTAANKDDNFIPLALPQPLAGSNAREPVHLNVQKDNIPGLAFLAGGKKIFTAAEFRNIQIVGSDVGI